jgi:hypothetical protein
MPAKSVFAVGSDDAAPALFGREPLMIELRYTLAHGRRRLDAFDSTDLRETFAAKNMARSVTSDTGS